MLRALSHLAGGRATATGRRPLGAVRARCVVIATVLTAGALAAAPQLAEAGTWYVNGTVVNSTASVVPNCQANGGSGVGCVALGPNTVSWDDASHVTAPTSPLASGSNGVFSFQADGLWEGADMYALYTMPDNSKYEIIAEDDVGDADPTYGNYAGCSESSVQGSIYVCGPTWGGSSEHMTPVYTFAPSASALETSAGQVCSGELGGSTAPIDCTGTHQFAPPDPNHQMALTFAAKTNGSVAITDTGNGSNCRLSNLGDQCMILTSGTGVDDIRMAALDTSSPASYSVEIAAEADVEYPDYVPAIIPTWPPGDTDTAKPARPTLSSLTISPPRARHAPSRALPVLRAGRIARITYRDTRASTTVFTLARARSGTRRGNHCSPRRGTDEHVERCTRWVSLGPPTVQSSLSLLRARAGAGCGLRKPGRSAPMQRCISRMILSGSFAHRDGPGRNSLDFSGRLDSHVLRAGLYKLTARARGHGTTLLSPPASVRFRIAR
jgi:hypothetical protein